MKKLLTVLLVVALVFAFVGCNNTTSEPEKSDSADTEQAAEETQDVAEDTPAEDATDEVGEPLKIAYLAKNMAVQWMQNVDIALQQLSEEYDFEYQVYDAQASIETQLNQLDQAIAEGVNGVVCLIADTGSAQAIADKCEAAGVALVGESLRLQDGDGNFVAPCVELSAKDCGAMCSEWIVENYEALGFDLGDYSTVGFAAFTNSTQPNNNERCEGAENMFKELLPDFPEENMFRGDVASESVGYQEAAHNQMNGLITANPQIETWLLMASLEEYGQGVARSIEENGITDKVILTSIGGEIAVNEWASDNPPAHWYAASYFNAMDCASLCVEGILAMLNDGVAAEDLWPEDKLEGQTYSCTKFSGRMITAENYAEYVTE